MDFTAGFVAALASLALGIAFAKATISIFDWVSDVNIATQKKGWSVEDYKELRQRIDALDERIDALDARTDALEPKED